MADTFQSVVDQLQDVNDQTDTLVSLAKKNVEQTSPFEGVADILKGDLKSGFGDILGTITGPLKAFTSSVPGLSTLGKITSSISKNAIKNVKEKIKESKLDKKEHKQNVVLEKENIEQVYEVVNSQEDMESVLNSINENTRYMAESIGMQAKDDGLNAAEVEKSREDKRANDAQTSALEAVADNTKNLENMPEGDKKEGGIFSGIISSFMGVKAALVAIPAIISGIVAAISAFGVALAPLILPIIAVVAGIVAAIGFIKGFMEGFSEGGIFGGLKAGMMKLFDWFIALPINILKDITVWALNALGMENLANALDAFPLVESLRKMFSFVVDLFIVPIGFIMDTIGGVISAIFGGFMKQFENLKNFFLSAFGAIDDIFGGIMMIFSGDIIGGLGAIWDGIKSLIMAPINLVKDTIMMLFGTLFNILMAPFNAFKDAIGYIFGPQSALGGVYTFLADMFSGLFDLITLPFRKVWEFVSTIFTDPLGALQALWNGLTGGVANLLGLITMPIDAAINWVMGLFGFGDPDKPFSLLGLVGDAVGSIWDWFKGLFSFDPSGLMEGLFSIGKIMKGLAKGGWAAVKAMLPGGESPGEAFSRVYNEVTSGGEGKMPTDQMKSEENATTQTAQTQQVSPEVQSINDQLSNVQSQREELKEKLENTPGYKRLTQRRIKDADRQLAVQEKKLLEQKSNLTATEPTYPKKMQHGYVGTSAGRVFYKYNPDGSITVPEDQNKASSEYGMFSQSGDIKPVPESSTTIQKSQSLERANITSADISRDYMTNNKGSSTVVAPITNTTNNVSSGGGSTIIPVSMSDNSSASQAAAAGAY